ncbi:MAG: YHYH protein [Planctomycetia bacterium]|nr:YHYH protein [Planctomycetia bacterium]
MPPPLRLLLVCLASASTVWAQSAESTTAVGGRWSLEDGLAKPRYLFRDADREVDLFSYHQSDSNKDGIDEIGLRHEEGFLVMESQGWPNHPTATFPNSGNPNTIHVQEFTFRLPLEPRKSAEITRLPMGPIGVALNGVVFFNPFEQGGMNAVEGYSEVWLDSCCGHPQQTGIYHYHKYPTCVKSPFADDGTRHSPVIGFAFDGFPIHGPYESDGVMAMGLTGDAALDVCNGHEDAERGYHYHVTPGRFPYVIGGYRGVPEPANNRGIRRMVAGAIENNAEGESRLEPVIAEVRPGSVARGGRREVTLVLDPRGATRGPIPTDTPAWVQFGPYEAVAIAREGNTVTATIDVPADASLGMLLDCHLEFEAGQRTRAVKKNAVMRIVE